MVLTKWFDCSRALRTWIGLRSVEESAWIPERVEGRGLDIRGSALAATRDCRHERTDWPESTSGGNDYRHRLLTRYEYLLRPAEEAPRAAQK